MGLLRRRPIGCVTRMALVAMTAVTVLVLAAVIVRVVVLPGYRPALRPGERFGVDVSMHQGAVDWAAVAGDDIGFAYIKATEGGDWVDERFTDNWRGAAAAGVARGAYHYFTFCRPAVEQADHFLRVVPTDPDALPPALDVEEGGNCSARPTREQLTAELRVWIERVEAATGRSVVLYLLDDVDGAAVLRRTLGRPLWARSVLRRPSGDDWAVWQVSGWARVAGIDTRADLNVAAPPPT